MASASKTVDRINGITTMAADLDTKAKFITRVNAFQMGQEMSNGFNAITQEVTQMLPQGGGSFTEKEQAMLCDAYVAFAKAHQTLLATLDSKHGTLETTGTAHQLAATLRAFEGAADELGFTVIGEIPQSAQKATAEKNALDKSVATTLSTYSGGN